MKKLVFILAVFMGLSFVMSAQVDEEEGQYFGGVRSVNTQAYAQYDFGNITSDIVSHEFIVKNPSPTEMTIESINIPDGVTVTVVNKVIKPRSEGKIIVTINKNYFSNTGEFSLPLIVRTSQKVGQGMNVYKEFVYMIKGTVK